MEKMGRQKLVDKTIVPQENVPSPLQMASYTPAHAMQDNLGMFLIGGYKGQAAFVDLDKLVNEPLALVESLYCRDKIDSRDAITAHVPVDAEDGDSPVVATLAVPAGELWILTRVDLACLVTAVAGETIAVNFRISTWKYPDARGGDTVPEAGRAYLAVPEVATDGNAIAEEIVFEGNDELGAPLRLPSGSVITLTAAATGDAITDDGRDVTLTPYGRKIRRLVN